MHRKRTEKATPAVIERLEGALGVRKRKGRGPIRRARAAEDGEMKLFATPSFSLLSIF
jgi:hypothetical protein